MLKYNQFNLHYIEYSINQNSQPGWELVPLIVGQIAKSMLPFNAWLYEWNSEGRYYAKYKEFNNVNLDAFVNLLTEYIIRDSICIIKTNRNTYIEHLLQNYSKVTEGPISENRKSEVFPAPIEVDDWVNVGKSELALVIHHDGDPLFILTNI